MRRKKHKHTRKSVGFYKVNYGFKEPFKVLLDGNFVHATLEANLANLEDHLPTLLGGPVKLYTTRCVMAELRGLGPDMARATAAARAQALHKCGHGTGGKGSGDPPLPAADCLLQQVGAANTEHWWIATQDKALAAQLAAVPGAPRLFASVNGLHLAEPPERARRAVAAAQAAQQAVPRHERESEALRDLPELVRAASTPGSAQFRRKRAQAPNPLAVKKKKAKPGQQQQHRHAGGQQQAGEGDEAAKKRRRRKKAGSSEGGG